MKLKNILLLSVIAAITCCVMTSCEKNEWCNITEVNTTTNWGAKIYFDGKAGNYGFLIEPGESGINGFQENYDKPDLNNPIDVKVEWYKNTNREKADGKIDHEFVITDYKFDYGKNYKITIREKNFSIQQIQ